MSIASFARRLAGLPRLFVLDSVQRKNHSNRAIPHRSVRFNRCVKRSALTANYPIVQYCNFGLT